MKKPTEFETLAELQTYPVTERIIFSASTMRMYLRSVGMYLYLKDLFEGKFDTPILDGDGNPTGQFEHHPAKEDVCMLFESLKAPNADGQDFNFIEFREDGVTPTVFGQGNISALDTMITTTLPDKAPQLNILKGLCIGKSNTVTHPYADWTQEMFDAAKAKAKIKPTEATYSNGRTNLLKVGATAFNIAITITDETIPEGLYFTATIMTCDKSEQQDVDEAYEDVDGSWRINSPKNSKTINYAMPIDYSHNTHNRLFITPSVPVNFDVTAK